MKIKTWGTRGSIPTPQLPDHNKDRICDLIDAAKASDLSTEDFVNSLKRHQFDGYGGNTTCVEVTEGETSLFIDCGSGMRVAGQEYLKGPCGKGQGIVNIYLTHFHWDHIMGLAFFPPIFIPGNQVNFFSPDPFLETAIKALFSKPNFPVPFEFLGAEINFYEIKPRLPFKIGELTITPYKLDHPDPCWGIRVESKGKSYSHCVDTEAKRITAEELGEDLGMYTDSDVLYFDSQYSYSDHLTKVDWGHAASILGIDLALAHNINKLIFTHHDPNASDEDLYHLEEETKRYIQTMSVAFPHVRDIEWAMAYDGMEFEV